MSLRALRFQQQLIDKPALSLFVCSIFLGGGLGGLLVQAVAQLCNAGTCHRWIIKKEKIETAVDGRAHSDVTADMRAVIRRRVTGGGAAAPSAARRYQLSAIISPL